jgi:hypothetical protein
MGKHRFKIMDVFKIGDRLCVVARMRPFVNFPSDKVPLGEYHNGYVQVSDKNKGVPYDRFVSKIETDELTFGGELNTSSRRIPKKTWFFGFDSAHYWNDLDPASKTRMDVKVRTKRLAEEMIEKGI